MQLSKEMQGLGTFMRRTPPPVVIQLSTLEHDALMRFMREAEGLTRAQAARRLILTALSERRSYKPEAGGLSERARNVALGGLADSLRRFIDQDRQALGA